MHDIRDIAVSPAEEAHMFLERVEFPMKKAELIRHAQERGASPSVIEMLEPIKEIEYMSAVDVLREIRGLAPHREVP